MSERRKLGFVTIGQSPRDDIVPEVLGWIGAVQHVERGALDGLSAGEIGNLRPSPEDYTLVTGLRDGSSATVAKRRILPRIQTAIADLEEEGAEAVLLLCTGEFPEVEHRCPLLASERLFVGGVRTLAHGARLGVICPLAQQIRETREKWADVGADLRVEAGSPYNDGPDEVLRAARCLKEAGVEYVVLDCMGYTGKMKDVVRREICVPTLLARSVVARLTAELL